jgi:putative oxidoreductase
MIVAYITADREALFSIISNPDKFTAAAPYTFLVASLLVLILGPGRFSLDALVTRRRDKRRIRRTLTETSGSAVVA